jgi:hypothetical protein
VIRRNSNDTDVACLGGETKIVINVQVILKKQLALLSEAQITRHKESVRRSGKQQY